MDTLVMLQLLAGLTAEGLKLVNQASAEGKPQPSMDDVMQAYTAGHGAMENLRQVVARVSAPSPSTPPDRVH